jgi:rod shape-determining protein MreC
VAANRQTSQRVTLVMLVLVSVTVITLDYRGEASHGIGHVRNGVTDALAPLQRGVAAVLHPFGDVVSSAFHYGSLQAQNAQLREEIGALDDQAAARAYAAGAQDAELLRLAHLPFAPNVPQVLTQVISRSTSNFADQVEISSGSAAGVGKGMPVVSDGGLIGRVSTAADSTAFVSLLTASGTTIAVEDTRNGAFYVADGGGAGRPLTFETVTAATPPRRGDQLVTSGADAGAYPPAIPVGSVASVSTAPGGLNVVVTVTPTARLSDLRFLTVLQWLPPA